MLPLAIWAMLSAALAIAAHLYLGVILARETEAAFARANHAATLTLQAQKARQHLAHTTFRLLNLRHLMHLASNPAAVHAISTELRLIAQDSQNGIFNLGYTSPDGAITWWTDSQYQGVDVSSRDFFQRLVNEPELDFAIGEPNYNQHARHWTTPVIHRTQDADENPDGYALIVFDPVILSLQLAHIDATPGRDLRLVNLETGTVFAANHDLYAHLEHTQRPSPDLDPPLQGARAAVSSQLAYTDPVDGTRRLAAFQVNPITRTAAIASFDEHDELAAFRRQQVTLTLCVAALALASLVVSFVWRQNSRIRALLWQEATRDPLTSLHNRRAAGQQLSRMSPAPGRAFSCLLFDLDHFKRVNDRFGHAAGDAALKAVAQILQQAVRRGDLVCRWGGEELLVILANCSPADALRRAEAFRSAIEALRLPLPQGELRLTTSIGMAHCPDHGTDLETLSRAADQALYRAKSAGRNQVQVAAPHLVPA